jgi:hypothetical protein
MIEMRDKLKEHQLKIATILNARDIFADEDIQFIYSEYPMPRKRKIDLIFIDGKSRYIIVELKKESNFRIEKAASQLDDYRKGLMQRFNIKNAEVPEYFRFYIVSDTPDYRKVKDDWFKFRELDKSLLDLQKYNFILDNRIDEHRLKELKPQITFSVDEALRIWEAPEKIRNIISEAQNSVAKTIPQFYLEVELKGTLKLEMGERLNLVSPLFSWKRLGQFQLRKRGVTFYFLIDCLVNPITLDRPRDYSKYDRFEKVSWKMPVHWSHKIRIDSIQGLKQFDDFCSCIRDDWALITSQ